ncbi:MAG: TraR/DksA family transcriptional regulator, partial [Gammaproteobacteria bacterium]
MKGKFAEYRATLEAKKEELSERLSQIEKDVRHIEKPLERDFEEQAVERQNDEVLDALDATTREEIEA